MLKTTSFLKALAKIFWGNSISAYKKVCNLADTSAVRLAQGLK